jgi:hypothetical protein
MHPANIVTVDGDLAGVIDFGELCAGDPAQISRQPGCCYRRRDS